MFSVRDYGAKADGKTLNTKMIQAAIDACHNADGGRVILDEPGVYLSGSLELKSNVELHLPSGSRILGSTDHGDYNELISPGFNHELAPEGTATYLIGAMHADNVAITGTGTVDASGPAFFDHTKTRANGKFDVKPAFRPRLLMMHKCTNVKLEDVSFVDSPCWTVWLMQCEQVHIHHLKISGDQRMLNNDGIDIDACRNVTMSDCVIKTDDDCIVIRSIQKIYDTPAICENVTVSNCVLDSTCQCVRISCPSDHIARNCVFSNITMNSSNNGINFDFPARYVTGDSAGADVSNISFSNVIINSKRHPIRIEAQEGVKLTRVSGITFSDMRLHSDFPCVIRGNKDCIITDVTFNNVRIDITGEEAIHCTKCKGVKMNNVEISNG